jgi:hypothetical protein
LANKCMLMAALAYNLKKMMKFKSNRPMASIKQLTKPINDFFCLLIFPSNFFNRFTF